MKRSPASPPSPSPAPPPTRHYFSRHPLPAAERDTKRDGDAAEDAGDGAPERAGQSSTQRPRWIEARARGRTLRLAAGAGVFSRGGLDAGSALLIETARFEDDARVLDLGCGWGALGCFAAALTPRATVWMCDINRRAAELARRNVRDNGLANASVWCGDGGQAARAASFDTVLCNPPVRAGNAVMARLFSDAQRVLKSGGALWIVLRTAQGAKSWQRRLHAQFGNCQTVALERGYRVLKSVKE